MRMRRFMGECTPLGGQIIIHHHSQSCQSCCMSYIPTCSHRVKQRPCCIVKVKEKREEDKKVAVVRADSLLAGKGRSGTVTTSYLITYCDMSVSDALNLFSEKRMRVGRGVSIPSQRRWVNYVALWNEHGRAYNEISIQILRIEVWGLRDGTLEMGVASFVDNESTSMKKVEPCHIFTKEETTTKSAVTVFTPSVKIAVLSDVNIFLARHQKGTSKMMPLSLAHCWFNAYFEKILEGSKGEHHYFEVDWEHMDGIGGTNKKLAQAFDRMQVTWKLADSPSADDLHHTRRSSTMGSLSTAGRTIAGIQS